MGALEDLEENLVEGEAGRVPGWQPPAHLGPLPVELESRARRLLANQQELIVALEQTRRDTARHLLAVRSVPASRSDSSSIYLDVSG